MFLANGVDHCRVDEDDHLQLNGKLYKLSGRKLCILFGRFLHTLDAILWLVKGTALDS